MSLQEKITNNSCKICGEKENKSKIYFSNDDINLYICESCSIIYQKNPNLINHEQSSVVYDDKNLAHRKRIEKILINVAKSRYKWIKNHIHNKVELTSLEIGGATGEFSNILSTDHWGVKINELSQPFALEASQRYALTIDSNLLTKDSYKEGEFDWVFLFHVLEHLPNPKEILGLIHSFLNESGNLAIIVPNVFSFNDRLYKKNNPNLNKRDHLFHYSVQSLRLFLENNGFEIVEIKTNEPKHNWVTTFTGYLSSKKKNHKTNTENRNKQENVKSNFFSKIKAVLPYFIGSISSIFLWPLFLILNKYYLGHEILCIAKKKS